MIRAFFVKKTIILQKRLELATKEPFERFTPFWTKLSNGSF